MDSAPARPKWFQGAALVPSIFAADFSRLGEQLGSLLDVGARIFHFDVGDGHFIDEITMGPAVLKSIAPLVHQKGGVIGCHLMVDDPERQLERLKSAGADGVSFHIEAPVDPANVIAHARRLQLSVGLAFNPETSVEMAALSGESADFFLCMSVHPGSSGQSFLADTYDRIRRLRKLRPSAIIQVDGGIQENNISEVKRAGADLIVAGSAVFWEGNPGAAFKKLLAHILPI